MTILLQVIKLILEITTNSLRDYFKQDKVAEVAKPVDRDLADSLRERVRRAEDSAGASGGNSEDRPGG